ncbi:hypothetical protein A2572_03740 [Candidatus Collierbacteria bacterium RIFOXYD1_FULL_40_9]|uniref:DUF11 domain-containing protein n=1 Tax=Candidatus Collierbacteria bacterium RIFOXYD1_FULL_40_9 TaxID=1817731 RepID=A0A1F5FTD9_9BACT|nr:MAG: hypothetical protein A2572_03740 [Candidatus Collierbacteria bacterium RIFOXYD1_FULL_40_9]
MKLYTFITTATFLSLLLLTFASTAHAKIGLTVDPSLVKIQIKPGKAITKAFTVENNSDTQKQIVVRLIPFEKADSNGNPIIDIKSNSSWLKYFAISNTNIKFEEPFTIEPNSKEQIILSLSIPETANIEDIYATLLFSTYENTLPSQSKGTIVSASIGANLLVTITSELNPKTILKIDTIKITSPHLKIGRKIFSDSLTTLTYQLFVSNTGNHVTETKGTTSISKNDIVLSVQKLLPQHVISKSNRQLLNSDGTQDFTFKPNTLSFGWHSIKTNIKTESTNSNNSTDIFIFPLKILLGLLLVLFLLKTILKFSKEKS